jgi:hypothetical protein
VSYTDISGGWGGSGGNNKNANPLFVTGTYRLSCGSPNSPCIDEGLDSNVPGDSKDVDENPGNDSFPTRDRDILFRIINEDNGTTDVDMGAYEKQTLEGSCPGDIAGNGDGPDGTVDVDDLLEVINNWGDNPSTAGDAAPAPCGNGVIDVDDLLAIINNWGACGEPTDAPETVDDCFDLCEGLSTESEDWQKCMNVCLESIED